MTTEWQTDATNKKMQSNKTRGCVKSVGVKFGNDQIFDMENFDEVSRRIEWSKNEFSHSLSPEPTPIARRCSAIAVRVQDSAWLSFIRYVWIMFVPSALR
jgi:hypothetical protein